MRFIVTLAFVTFSAAAFAYPSDPVSSANPTYNQAVELINQEKYKDAIPLLTDVVKAEPKNADAYNYLGYSFRQTGDLDKALENYQTALKIDPDHKGANSYLGVLYLMKKELPKAEECLQVLKKACPSGCVELKDLEKQVEIYKQNGKPAANAY